MTFNLSVEQVHIKSRFILNGVCAKWRGWIDMDRLDGVGCVEFDEEAARVSHFKYYYHFQSKNLIATELPRPQRSTSVDPSV